MELEMDPMCLRLGLPSRSIPTKSGKRLYNILTFAAIKNILLQWINNKSPSVNGWFKVLLELIPCLEYLTIITQRARYRVQAWVFRVQI